jgi:hypothetical protein
MQSTSPLLSVTEHRILAALRQVPHGPVRARLETFLVELTRLVSDPGCAQIQADGIPCGSASADCEECLQLEQLLRTLRATLPQS